MSRIYYLYCNHQEEETSEDQEEEDLSQAEESLHLTSASLVKMFGMNILDVVKLKSAGGFCIVFY